MGNKSKHMFSMGGFARICGVDKQTLIYYDKIGLFKPSHVDEKGFRFYDYHQYDLFLTLQVLKALNLPLDEIRDYLDHRNYGNFVALFQECLRRVEHEIKHFNGLKSMITLKLDVVETGMSYEPDVVHRVQLPAAWLLLSDPIENEETSERLSAISTLTSKRQGLYLKDGSLFGEMAFSRQKENKNGDQNFFTSRWKSPREKEATTCAKAGIIWYCIIPEHIQVRR